jgi:hypothetical protein
MHVHTNDVWEILKLFEKQTTKKDRMKILKDNESWALKDLLRGSFDDSIEFILPAGRPAFVASRPESVPSNWSKQNSQLQYFVKNGPGASLPAFKRESMFIRLLEQIHANDAEYVLQMVEKKLSVKGLTKTVVKEVFPDLIKK